jgi:hypothetical protein
MSVFQNTSLLNRKREIIFISLIILLFVFRSAIPLFKYPFLLIATVYSIYVVLKYRQGIFEELKLFFKNYSLLLILFILLLISFAFSQKIYLSVLKDIINAIVLFTLFFLLMFVVTSKNEIKYFEDSFVSLSIIFALIISVLVLLNIYDIFHYADYYSSYDIKVMDYNFALLPVFYAFLGILHSVMKPISKSKQLISNIILILFSFYIFSAGSRRGIFLFSIICILVVTNKIVSIFKKKGTFFTLGSNLNIFILWLLLFPVFLFFFIFHTSYNFKSRSLELIGSKNGYYAKTNLSSNLYRYVSLFNRDITLADFYKKTWSVSFDPRDPDNGWGEGIFKVVYPLNGQNVEIVPAGSKGYLLDKTCRYFHSNHHAYTNTLIRNNKVEKSDVLLASVYCFVSDEFNGSMVCIRSEGSTFGNTVAQYNLNQKDVWQKLSISAICDAGNAPVYLYFNYQGVTDFSKLKGFVIFAYPHYEIKDSSSDSSGISENEIRKISHKSLENDVHILNGKFYNKDLLIYRPSDVNSLYGHEAIKKTSYINVIKASFFLPRIKQERQMTGLYDSGKSFQDSVLLGTDTDLIRNWIAKLISEDTTFFPFKNDLQVSNSANDFSDGRISRWSFAIQIFLKEFNWRQKIFGGGFSFLNWYGYYFDRDKTISDYPHNPFLYILLYSGIIGLVLYIFLLYKVFYYYLKYSREAPLLFIFFLITFFFAFFSGGSPFDPPIMGFFAILPFFIHSIHKKEDQKNLRLSDRERTIK